MMNSSKATIAMFFTFALFIALSTSTIKVQAQPLRLSSRVRRCSWYDVVCHVEETVDGIAELTGPALDALTDLILGAEDEAKNQAVNFDCKAVVSKVLNTIASKMDMTGNDFCDKAVLNGATTAVMGIAKQYSQAMLGIQCTATMTSCCAGETTDDPVAQQIC
eukprot:Pgem_evm1s19891